MVACAGWLTCVAPAPAAEAPLTVTGLIVDKTDKNAVVARDAAIAEARRLAFQIIAQRSLTAEEFKSFTMPDDKAIALVVQDFEIKNEQLGSNRYVASFTVRFTPEINAYINVPAGLGPVIDMNGAVANAAPGADPQAAAGATPAAVPAVMPVQQPAGPYVVPDGARNILLLPYLKDTSGKKMLWEDPNPWREAWQERGNTTRPPEMTFTMPQGDLDDVAAGNTDAPWLGQYDVLEKLRAAYGATEVALAVANQSVTPAAVDLFLYHDGRMVRLKSLPGFTMDGIDAMIPRVVDALAAPQVDDAAPVREAPAPAAADVADGAANAALKLSLIMHFDTFGQWADAQRRLASVSPPLTVDIGGLTRNAARFNVTYTGGGIETFKATLISKGLGLGEPGTSGDAAVGPNVYELTLLSQTTP